MSSIKFRLLSAAGLAAMLGALPQGALAQAGTPAGTPAGTQAGDDELAEVVITGTSIRGMAAVGSEPINYGRAEFEHDAPVDVRDALANLPQISNFGTDADVSTSNRFRTAGYQPIIHNLGIYSTLTLFNGHRMADVGGEAVFPDPAIIPTIAIQRVDVIADGSSAIYGSDAVAGVVNFLYRRGVNGFETSLTEGTDRSTSWANRNIGALWGKTFGSGEVMVAYEYSKEQRPSLSEYDFTANADHTALGGSDLRSTNCEYPIVRFGTTNYAGPNRTAATYRCNPDGGTNLSSNGVRNAVLATARYKMRDNLELWTELNFSDFKSDRIAPWGNGGRWQVTVPSTSPGFIVPPGANPANITSENNRGDGVGIFGYRNRIANSRVHGFTAGADFDMGGEWRTSLLLHRSKTYDYIDDPGLDLQNVARLLLNGQFNPFNLTGNSDAVKAQINNGFTQLNDASQSLTEVAIKADGPVLSMPGGKVLAAIGVSARTQHLEQLQSGGCPTCSFYQVVRDDDLSRGVNALFGELAVPLVGDPNARPGVRKLTLSLAGRYDDYEGLGTQFNPKFGVDYAPVAGVRIYGTWGKSYAAPNLGLVTSTFGVPQPGITDTKGGRSFNFDIYNLGGGAPSLEPEKAKSYTTGINWTPEFFSGFSAGLTYYHVEYSNLVYKPTRQDVLNNPAFANSVVLGDLVNGVYQPLSAAYVAQLIAAAPPQTPITAGQTFNMSFNSFAINLGTRVHAGYDANLKYDFRTPIGKWGVAVVANKQTRYDEEVVPGSGAFSRIGTGVAPPWAVRFQADWGANSIPLRIGLVSNYKSGYNDVGVSSASSYLIHNLTMSYDFEKLLHGVTAQVRVRNVADKDPPFYNVALGYDNRQATPYGRQFELTLRAKF